jgi:hypothetical protein
VKRYRLHSYELPELSETTKLMMVETDFDPPDGYRLHSMAPGGEGGRSVAVLWEREGEGDAEMRRYCNESPFTEQVIRQNAAAGNTEFLVMGATTSLRKGDRVVATFRDWSRAGSEPDQLVYWRGSVDDFATDVKALLTPDQLEALSVAVSLAWLEKKAGV